MTHVLSWFQNLSKRQIKAIKDPFKFLLVGLFIFLGFFFVNEAVLGTTILEENFEDCTLGNLADGNCGWLGQIDGIQNTWKVATSSPYGGEKSAYTTYVTPSYLDTWKIGTSTIAGDVSFFVNFKCVSDGNSDERFYFRLKDGGVSKIELKIAPKNLVCDDLAQEFTLSYASSSDWIVLKDNFIGDQYRNLILKFDGSLSKFKVLIDGGLWSDWLNPKASFTDLDTIELGFFPQVPNVGRLKIWVDNIGDKECDYFKTWYGCENAGCCWYYSPLFGNLCVSCPAGECASSIFECQNCLTEETCEAEDFCYWFNGICKYGTGVCGEGLALQFCENQAECEGAGGYWYSDYCWIDIAPSILNFDDYYAEYGDYATPSYWIVSVASSSAGFFESVGGFLSTFEKFFDIQEAYQKGIDFGSAIPTARGYLTIIDDFLGPLPISGFFIFILGFMLVVGVFRIVRNLIQLLKFW